MGLYLLVSSSGRSASMGRHATPWPLSFDQVTSDAPINHVPAVGLCIVLVRSRPQWREEDMRNVQRFRHLALPAITPRDRRRRAKWRIAWAPSRRRRWLGWGKVAVVGFAGLLFQSRPVSGVGGVECRCSREPLAGRRISYRAHVNLACA